MGAAERVREAPCLTCHDDSSRDWKPYEVPANARGARLTTAGYAAASGEVAEQAVEAASTLRPHRAR